MGRGGAPADARAVPVQLGDGRCAATPVRGACPRPGARRMPARRCARRLRAGGRSRKENRPLVAPVGGGATRPTARPRLRCMWRQSCGPVVRGGLCRGCGRGSQGHGPRARVAPWCAARARDPVRGARPRGEVRGVCAQAGVLARITDRGRHRVGGGGQLVRTPGRGSGVCGDRVVAELPEVGCVRGVAEVPKAGVRG